MKFINKNTKVIIEPNSEFVEEQLKKSTDFEEFKEKNKKKKSQLKRLENNKGGIYGF